MFESFRFKINTFKHFALQITGFFQFFDPWPSFLMLLLHCIKIFHVVVNLSHQKSNLPMLFKLKIQQCSLSSREQYLFLGSQPLL